MKANAPTEIQKDLKTRLQAIGATIYNEMAPVDADFPYVTIDFNNSDSDGSATEVVRLDIDGWDNMDETGGSTLRIEGVMEKVAEALEQELKLVEEGYSFRYILDQRRNIPDPDIQIRRRKYTFDVRVIGKE